MDTKDKKLRKKLNKLREDCRKEKCKIKGKAGVCWFRIVSTKKTKVGAQSFPVWGKKFKLSGACFFKEAWSLILGAYSPFLTDKKWAKRDEDMKACFYQVFHLNVECKCYEKP